MRAVYILGGLESVGSIPAPNTLTPEAVAEGLDNLRRSAEVVLSCGHFITKDMKAELDRTAFPRRAAVDLYVHCADRRRDCCPPAMSVWRAMARCRRMEIPSVRAASCRECESTFAAMAVRRVQTLYYVQANVADERSEIQRCGYSNGRPVSARATYLKAASVPASRTLFLAHSFLSSQSRLPSVLQDDSGIPFRFFWNGGWRCWFFGTYSGTLDIFAKYYQSDLHDRLCRAGRGLLPCRFGTGLQWRAGESNLLLAVRQQAPRPEFVSSAAIEHLSGQSRTIVERGQSGNGTNLRGGSG